MKEKSALIFYAIAGILYFVSTIIDNNALALCSKPFMSLSVLVFYIRESKLKVNYWFVIALLLLLCSGILNLFEDQVALKKIILINLFVYCILLSFMIIKLLEKRIKKINNFNLLFIFLTCIFLATLLYLCLFLIFSATSKLYLYIIVYSCILTFLGLLSTFLVLTNNKRANIFLVVASFCFIICDLFYVIYYYYYDFFFIRYVSILAHIFSFYFLVNYFILYDKKDTLSEIDF
jgi:hypothetical protein